MSFHIGQSMRKWFMVVLPLALILSACGANLSGEPDVAFERESFAAHSGPYLHAGRDGWQH
jgi:hypothetical protein